MLDIHTINKTLDWLKVRRDQTEKSGNCIGGLPHFEVQAKVKIIEDLIEELSGKASDLQTAIDAGGKHGNLIKEKEGKYITIYRCPTCGGKRNVRREYFAEVHIRILKKLFQYCVDNRTHLIQTRDIKTLNHVDYSMFAKLQRYGFIYFPDGRDNRKKDGRW